MECPAPVLSIQLPQDPHTSSPLIVIIPHYYPHRALASSDAVGVAVRVYFVGGKVSDAVSCDIVFMADLAGAVVDMVWHISCYPW